MPAKMTLRRFHRGLRGARMVAKALVSTRHTILAHLVVTRRCNLACAYCNEYDHFSEPVPLELLCQRIDDLASRGTSIITISGGEPLLHPELEQVVAHIRRRGIIATLITNGYLLTEQRIKRLNGARLDYLQISIDNVNPDEASMKSLKVLDSKLVLLSKYAEFGVNVNAVLGSAVENPEDAQVVVHRARELGFPTSLGIIHSGKGQAKPLSQRQQSIYRDIVRGKGPGIFTWLDRFGENLVQGRPNRWKCRAGARYLYVDEYGLVHWCSQQRGYPGVPLEHYSDEDMRRQYFMEKPCASYCTVQCVHRASMMDGWRHRQTPARVSHSRE